MSFDTCKKIKPIFSGYINPTNIPIEFKFFIRSGELQILNNNQPILTIHKNTKPFFKTYQGKDSENSLYISFGSMKAQIPIDKSSNKTQEFSVSTIFIFIHKPSTGEKGFTGLQFKEDYEAKKLTNIIEAFQISNKEDFKTMSESLFGLQF